MPYAAAKCDVMPIAAMNMARRIGKYLVQAWNACKSRTRYAVLASSAIALGGCETTLPSEMSHTEVKQLAQQIYQRCLDQGVAPGTN